MGRSVAENSPGSPFGYSDWCEAFELFRASLSLIAVRAMLVRQYCVGYTVPIKHHGLWHKLEEVVCAKHAQKPFQIQLSSHLVGSCYSQ